MRHARVVSSCRRSRGWAFFEVQSWLAVGAPIRSSKGKLSKWDSSAAENTQNRCSDGKDLAAGGTVWLWPLAMPPSPRRSPYPEANWKWELVLWSSRNDPSIISLITYSVSLPFFPSSLLPFPFSFSLFFFLAFISFSNDASHPSFCALSHPDCRCKLSYRRKGRGRVGLYIFAS